MHRATFTLPLFLSLFVLLLLEATGSDTALPADEQSESECESDTMAASAAVVSMDVVIVGAGVSGLVCAERLLRSSPGLAVTVLEARDRVGGRLLSTDAGVDLGGSWSWCVRAYLWCVCVMMGLL